ncbi:MAG: cobalamin biosynthesis protein CobD [Synergistaceae bacterium]|nr:cobalamin biosynthesis protein CobD [Synergistaceae bacterium]
MPVDGGAFSFGVIFCLAVLLDTVLGDPHGFPHPVVLIGRYIALWTKTSSRSFMRGLLLCVSTLALTAGIVGLMLWLTNGSIIVKVYLLYSALAWRDLKDETFPVLMCLLKHDITNARLYLSRVVGRDTGNLSEAEISRAAIETIAENSIDGVISVMFWACIGQVIDADYGACMFVWLFKAASTLDSMAGYESLGAFGWPSAKLDDILNFIPARLGGLVIVFAGRRGLRVFLRDRLKHKSPNSAHGESAFAGVLGVKLGGGAFYGGKFEPREWLNPDGRDPEAGDIVGAWRLLDTSCSLFAFLVILSLCLT